MVRFKVVLGWWEEPADGSKSSVYKEKTLKGLASGPSPKEALAQIEEYYGEEIQTITLEYTDDMDTPIYDTTYEEEEAWLTKED